MDSKVTIYVRRFLRLPSKTDRLNHAVNRIKKAQQYGNRNMPRLWAKAKGINDDIAVKTANFIIDTAVMYNADTIVFEHLDLAGKKRGSKKQRYSLPTLNPSTYNYRKWANYKSNLKKERQGSLALTCFLVHYNNIISYVAET